MSIAALSNIGVLFVCLGNICRSPTAHGVFQTLVQRRGLTERIVVDSCGTGDWHVGEAPDSRAVAAAAARGYDLRALRARRVIHSDFEHFDYILAMDRDNLRNLERLRPEGYSGHLGLLLDFAPACGLTEVPDPYYGGGDSFSRVLDLIEEASENLLVKLAGDVA